jgi:hypothetical protein
LPRTPNQPPAQVVPPAQPTQVASADAGVASATVETPQTKEDTASHNNAGLASLIGGIFGSSQSNAPAITNPPLPETRPRAIAVAKRKTQPTMQTASPVPKAAPQSKVAAAPKEPELRPAMKPEPQMATAKPQAPEPVREPEMRTAFQTPPKPGTMSGAQPVVPAGSFESRWSAFRSF